MSNKEITMNLGTSTNDATKIQSYFQNFSGHETTEIDANQNIVNDTNGIIYFVGKNDKNYYQTECNLPLISKIKNEEIEEEPQHQITSATKEEEILLSFEDPFQNFLVLSTDGNNDEYNNYTLINESNVDTAIDGDQQIYQNLSSTNEYFKNSVLTTENLFNTNLQNQIYKCVYCNYTNKNKYLVDRHVKVHSNERPHKCSVCEKGFKTKTSLKNHENIHTGIKPYRCKDCDAGFNSPCEVIRHSKYIHTHEKAHKCKICDYATVELSKLKRHIRIHTGEKPYQCSRCSYASPDAFKLKRHFRVHTGEKPYRCNICESSFTQSNSLKAHMLTHSSEGRKAFQCEYCPATHARKTDLRIHIERLHTSDKVLQCKCGQLFSDQYNYKLHMKTHQGEKCYKCQVCPYTAKIEKHLKTHMLIHTDEKPYECEVCKMCFRQKQLLKRHYNIYHNPNYIPPPSGEKNHKCPECGQSFKHIGNLIRHQVKHDPNSGFEEQQRALKLGRQKKVQIIEYREDDFLICADEFEEQNKNVAVLKQLSINNNDYSIMTDEQFIHFR